MCIGDRINLINFGILLILTQSNYQAKAQCSPGKYLMNGVCIPPTTTICPSNSIYSNGLCRYRSDYLCSGGTIYTNGVCAKAPVTIACFQSPQQCAPLMVCPSKNIEVCPYRQICPQNTVMYNGNCVTQSIAQCPKGTVLQNGHCVRPSICPTNSYMTQDGCIKIPKVEETELTNCPFGSHKSNHICVQDSNLICPLGSDFVNGICSREEECTGDHFIHNGVCAQCPVNSEYTNGECIQCRPDMILSNGRCSCEPSKILLNGDCVHINQEQCPDHEISTNGKCIPRYCYGSRCCFDSLCNSCFDSCEQLNTDSSSLSICQSNCMNNLPPTIEPVHSPIQIVNPAQNFTASDTSSDYSNIVNITNIVNSTNVHNIVTTANNSNINRIKLGADAKVMQKTSNNESTVYSIEKEENCCVISEPRRCEMRNDKYRCYHKRRHACGEDCLQIEETHHERQTVFIPPQPPQIIYQQLPPQPPPPTIIYQKMQPPPPTEEVIIQPSQPEILQQSYIVEQQPQYVEQTQYVQQPQYVQQSQYVQQPMYIQQSMYTQEQQPQFITGPMVIQQQPVVMQQPQIIQQSAVSQQLPICTYQNRWSFVNCLPQQKIDCDTCDRRLCGTYCYAQQNLIG